MERRSGAVRAVAHTMFDALSRHRNAARPLVEQIPLGPNAMALRERCAAVLLDSGLPPRGPPARTRASPSMFSGFAVQADGHGTAGPEGEQQAGVFASGDPALYPATLTVATSLPVPIEDEFSFGLGLLISGLERLGDDA
ncbi:TetR/AcrR family transcriptional regulator C-terminal domain-containing protein [Streptomyces sp. NPDC020489]|uniref:TetR/AcrR family transcriptional regulator C-terminal domain-containing protein n=1 Tax=Streptomyces sp. NPDC020489 TaxID=3365077 RepID=UPI0037B9D7E7